MRAELHDVPAPRRQYARSTGSGQPLLSVVVTTYTLARLGDVKELLQSLNAQTYANIEVVFVGERVPGLCEEIQSFSHSIGHTDLRTCFNSGEPGLSLARNLGVAQARGDIIAFVDDDVVLFPDWAENMVKPYADKAVIGVTGPSYPMWRDDRVQWLPKEFYWIVSCTEFTGWKEPRPVRTAWGMNMSFRREAFEHSAFSSSFGKTDGGVEALRAGPFDDAEFSIALRMKTGRILVYTPDAAVYHKVYGYRLTPQFVRRQAYWQGYSKALYRRIFRQDVDMRRLERERELLGRILLRLLPNILVEAFVHPRLAWQKCALSATVLFHVAVGYLAGAWPSFAGFATRYYR